MGPESRANVRVTNLSKTFVVPEREAGLRAAVGSLFHRKTRGVRAVDAISFEIGPGEVVGFLGPNGAGKTTTLKMLSGLLYPTSGQASVLGFLPSRREKDFLRGITLVMGNRNQLQWDLPALDSFELNRAIYRLRRDDFVAMRNELIELLEIDDLVRKPVRNLSLGERMKVEIVGSLLHRPRLLLLDEPKSRLGAMGDFYLTTMPMAFAITVPAEAITSRLHWSSVLTAASFAVVLLAFSRWFWRPRLPPEAGSI